MLEKFVSFPGLGIEPFKMDETAFTVFGLDVMWYGVIVTLGMVLGCIYAMSRARYEGVLDDDMFDLIIACILVGVLGARLYYVVFSFERFVIFGNTWWETALRTLENIFNIRNGGLAIYGGIIAGVLTAYVVARKKKIRFPVILDIAAPAVLIGQVIGRWGNFVNMEAFGSQCTLPWRMGLLYKSSGTDEFFYEIFVHPTFLYESLWNLIGFILIALFYKKKKYNGQVFLFYMSWYGLGRFFIEGLRTDSLTIGSLRVSQILAGLAFIVGSVLLVVFLKKTPKVMRIRKLEEIPLELRVILDDLGDPPRTPEDIWYVMEELGDDMDWAAIDEEYRRQKYANSMNPEDSANAVAAEGANMSDFFEDIGGRAETDGSDDGEADGASWADDKTETESETDHGEVD